MKKTLVGIGIVVLLFVTGIVYWTYKQAKFGEQTIPQVNTVQPEAFVTKNITIETYNGKFVGNDILIVPEYVNGAQTGVKWSMNYKNAKFYEEWQDKGQIFSRPGNLEDWVKMRKQIWSVGYEGPGVPGVIKINGFIDKEGVLQASRITQHVQ